MKRIDKISLFIISLIATGLSICVFFLFYPVPYIQDALKEILISFPWMGYVFAGYSAVICVGFFIIMIVIIFFPDQSDFLVVPKTKGRLLFSKKTVESTVRYSFSDLDSINYSRIRVKIHRIPDRTKVYVKLSLNNTSELAALTETVQERISSSLQTSLNISVKSITVKVIETDPDYVAKVSTVRNVE